MDLNKAAGEFEIINSETYLFYNTETGEFDFYADYMDIEEADAEKFEADEWVAAPQQRELGEYGIMSDFADTVSDKRKNELLNAALEGRGAFRRFKDTLQREGLEGEWYDFKHKAFIEIARKWCEDNGIEYINSMETQKSEPESIPEKGPAEPLAMPETKIAVTLTTLRSHNHIVGDIERGVKVYNGGGVEFEKHEQNMYWVKVPHKQENKFVNITFTRDGEDIKKHFCDCTWEENHPPVCRHVVAAALAIQGGIIETKLTLGKAASASTIVADNNTARAVGSGSLNVFSTPMMIALMERAACECLADCLDDAKTSVGTQINVEHTAASAVGSEITATATIDFVFGRKVEFAVTASDKSGEIGKGKHTRIIVDTESFMKKAHKP